MKKALTFLLLLVMINFLVACANREETYIENNAFLLNTIINIKIYDYNDQAVIEECFQLIRELENILSVHVEGSDLWHLKVNAGKQWVNVSQHTINVLEKSLKVSKMTNGLFDITAGPLINLWNIQPPEGYYPTENERNKAIDLVDYKNVKIDKVNHKAFLEKENMEVNLGAVAKGYIADQVKLVLKNKGVKKAIINLGGNVAVLGKHSENRPFLVGVQDPNSDRGDYVGMVDVVDQSVISSGVYERFFEYNNKRYHHILNPFTGFPEENNLMQVTIISKASIDGDIFSTAIFLLGLEEGLTRIEKLDGIDAVFITKNQQIYLSSGIKDKFKLRENTGYVVKGIEDRR